MKKTASITLDDIHCSDGWYELGINLGMKHERINEVFQYGEFGTLTIEVDEDLNIIGGKIHPCRKKLKK